uniref:Uncharacterized protein n=1 Tax=Oryza barthii TaxID=65489 RepID=A0A0D3ERY3_9ORYZ
MEMAVSGITAQLSTGLAILSAGAARDKGKELTVIDVDVNVGPSGMRRRRSRRARTPPPPAAVAAPPSRLAPAQPAEK